MFCFTFQSHNTASIWLNFIVFACYQQRRTIAHSHILLLLRTEKHKVRSKEICFEFG